MGTLFFQNGRSIGSDAGWCGYTGNNNYVVRYDFYTGPAGASEVAIALEGIYYGSGAGSQGFGFKISSSSTAYANVRNQTPDSSLGFMSYSSSGGYSCLLRAEGLNLPPDSLFYVFVYVATAGTEYYSGWNCTNPQIACSGSYSAPAGSISSVSSTVSTGSPVSIIMASPGREYHRAEFYYGGKRLARSEAFEASLSYICPREWMRENINAKSITVDVTVQAYRDPACTAEKGETLTASFLLTADPGMCPRLRSGAVADEVINEGMAAAFAGYIAGISRSRISFDADRIDMGSCAGAEIAGYRIKYRDTEISGSGTSLETAVLPGDCTVICTVTDSRGMEASESIKISPEPYVPPSLNGLGVLRCGSDGTEEENGRYFKLRASVICTPLGGRNGYTVSVSIQPTGGQWSGETELSGFESGIWSDEWASPSVLGGAMEGDSYTVRLTISDTLGSSSFYTLRLYHQQWAMKFNAGGTALGVGMAPTVDNALQIPDGWKLYAGALVLSDCSYGSAPPEEAVSNPAEGQLYFMLTD
ncbi:MAG: DUF859 family phage minor structural protein [Candidatus Limivicinus sp.]|jgi:hypothetical protein